MTTRIRKKLDVIKVVLLFVLLISGSTTYAGLLSSSQQKQALGILDKCGVKGGLIVHIGCGDGKLTVALRTNDSFLVQGLDRKAGNVQMARKYIQTLGLYGVVSVDKLHSEYQRLSKAIQHNNNLRFEFKEAGQAANELRLGGRAARVRRHRHRRQLGPGGPRGHLPRQRQGRPARQQDLLRRTPHAHRVRPRRPQP